MSEIGLGHNSGAFEIPGTRKFFDQLSGIWTSVLDLSPGELKRRRQLLALTLIAEGKQTRRCLVGDALSVHVNDHHKRFNVWGQARAIFSAADDLNTAFPDDERANHLYKADDLQLRADGMATYLAETAEVVVIAQEDHEGVEEGAEKPDILDELLEMHPELRVESAGDGDEEVETDPVPDTLDRVLATGDDLQDDEVA